MSARRARPTRRRIAATRRQHGFTLLETLVTLVIAALICVALAEVVTGALDASEATRERNDLTRQARFAMQRMVAAVNATTALLLPLPDDPGTAQDESARDPGVLAVTLDPTLDRDADGFADADNDKDGKIDEDLGADVTDDNAPGVAGLDDDNDGSVDEGGDNADDDEDGAADEDRIDGADNDGDGAVDEDPGADANADGAPGVVDVDDDLDTLVDEGVVADDDEDGAVDEDWLDVVAYFVAGTELKERTPDVGAASGAAYTERTVAGNVTTFVVERVPQGAGRAVLVDITLGLTSGTTTVKLDTRVRVGAGL